jgi:putative membrane protein
VKRWPAALGVLVGLSILVALVGAFGARGIGELVAGAGWWLPLVIALHVPQTVFSALGWKSLIDDPHQPSAARIFGYRWIRESVNSLLPVAQVGGDIVRARLLALSGVRLGQAAASCTVDLTLEMASQIVFSLLGIGLLLVAPHGAQITRMAVTVTAVAVIITAGFIAFQRSGGLHAFGRLLSRQAEKRNWSSLGQISEFAPAVGALYRNPRRLAAAFLFHLTSWLLGSVETYAGLFALGLHPSLREAVVIESLGQIVRALGFAVPGALGVQEGGYILICGLFGVSPQGALALSLIRRIRELTLGLPGLIAWQRIESGHSTLKARTAAVVLGE